MDPSNPPNAHSTSQAPPSSVDDLPPGAIALATRLFNAARAGETEIFEQAFARGMKPNLTNEKGDSLIMLASYHGRLPLTRLLLRVGADPNRLNDRSQSPLAGAIFKGEDEIVEALLDGGADPRLSTPSAAECIQMFGAQDKWGSKLEEVVRRLDREGGVIENGHAANGHGHGEAKVQGE